MINVREYGLKGDGTDEDADAIEGMIEDALSQRMEPDGHGVTLFWPAGIYRIPRPIRIKRSGYEFYKLRFLGEGKDQTHIRAKVYANNVFEFINPAYHYSAQLSFHGIHFYGGNAVVRIDNCFYSEFVDCVFRRTGEGGGYSIELHGNTGGVRVLNCWTFHAEDFLYAETGNVHMADCLIGEDAGGICVGHQLTAVGCQFWGPYSRTNTPTGRPAAIHVSGNEAHIVGCSASVPSGSAFIDVHWPSTVHLADNDFTLNGDSPVVRTAFLGHTRPGFAARGVSIRGGSARVLGDTHLWETTGSNKVANSVIEGVRFHMASTVNVTVPDEFFDPRYRNVYRDNFVQVG